MKFQFPDIKAFRHLAETSNPPQKGHVLGQLPGFFPIGAT